MTNTSKPKKIADTAAAWESGRLGQDAEFVRPATEQELAALDDALGMQLISIRLPKALIEDLKALAHLHGVGYQPLMRDIVNRFVQAEKKQRVSPRETVRQMVASQTPRPVKAAKQSRTDKVSKAA